MSTWFRTYGYAEVLDGLLIGAYPLDAEDVAMLEWAGVKRILNLVEDREYGFAQRGVVESMLESAAIEEHRLPLADYGGLAHDELEAAVQEVRAWLDEGVRTYVHCRAGWQRSAAVAAGVIALRDGIDIDGALAYVQQRKPSADPLPHQREDLRRWWEDRGGVEADAGGERRAGVEADAGGERRGLVETEGDEEYRGLVESEEPAPRPRADGGP